MSNIMQLAEEALSFWEPDSMWSRLIERDIDANDLEALAFHVKQANTEKDMIERSDELQKNFDLFIMGGEPLRLLENLPRVPLPESAEETKR